MIATATDDSSALLTALSISPVGASPQRWFVDWSHFEPGMLPHPHIYVINPYELADHGPMNIWCQTCFIQFNLFIVPQDICRGLTHHLHTEIGHGTVAASCCHCGLQINAIKEQPAIPRSLITRLEKARKPKANDPTAPHFHNTLSLLIRVLKDAVTPPNEAIANNPGSINTESKAFKNSIGLDEASRAFFDHVQFMLIDDRYHPPKPTPENIQFLNRCRFQLELVLWLSKQQQSRGLMEYWHGTNNDIKIVYAFDHVLKRLGILKYSRDPRARVLDLTNPSTLNAEKISDSKLLGCVSDMCDDTIIDTFRTQVSHDTTKAHARVDALVKLQKTRKSEQIDLEIVCKRSEGIVTSEELRRAYRAFEIPNEGVNISSEIILGLIRASLYTNSRENLKIIAKARNDPELNRLVDESSTEYPLVIDEDLLQYYAQNPVGLSNIGNTCYLNSLLQYIYTIKDIRETVLNMEEYVENEDAEDWKGKVVDGRSLSRQYVAAAKELVRELKGLFSQMESAKTRSITPSNRLVELLLPPEVDEPTPNGDNALTVYNGRQKGYQFFRQQDVSETLAILMAKLNAAFKPVQLTEDNKPEDRFNTLFYVKAHRKTLEINKETGEKKIERIPEDFSTLLLNVGEEDVSMEELIDDYFESPEKNIAHEVKKDDESSKPEDQPTTPSHRHITVTELPPVLQIQLMRTHFNRSYMTSYKSNANVSIPKRLHMDQYLEPNQEENADRIKRIKLWKDERSQCRLALEQIKLGREIAEELRKFDELPASSAPQPSGDAPAEQPQPEEAPPKNIPPEECIQESETDKPPAVQNAVTNVQIETNVQVETDEAEEAEQRARISSLTKMIQDEIASLSGLSEYKLHAVFHHEGGADFGHYWVYILDDQAEEPRWLKYSDDRIEVAQESEVLTGTQGSSACFCVYTRANSETVHTVWRCIAE